MKRQRAIAGNGAPSPSDFCEFFPPEFRTACDPYCWACGPAAGGGRPAHELAHAGALAGGGCARGGAHGAFEYHAGHDPEDVDLHPYFWDLKEDGCT